MLGPSREKAGYPSYALIDEGFVTLDPRSLETALSVLDSLRTQGR